MDKSPERYITIDSIESDDNGMEDLTITVRLDDDEDHSLVGHGYNLGSIQSEGNSHGRIGGNQDMNVEKGEPSKKRDQKREISQEEPKVFEIEEDTSDSDIIEDIGPDPTDEEILKQIRLPGWQPKIIQKHGKKVFKDPILNWVSVIPSASRVPPWRRDNLPKENVKHKDMKPPTRSRVNISLIDFLMENKEKIKLHCSVDECKSYVSRVMGGDETLGPGDNITELVYALRKNMDDIARVLASAPDQWDIVCLVLHWKNG